MHPDLFTRYDVLHEHLASARQAVQDLRYPPDEDYDDLQKRYDDLSAQYDATNNRASQRQIRAQIRDVSNQWADLDERRAAFESHATAQTPELASARQRVMEADYAIRDMLPDVQAAYRLEQSELARALGMPSLPSQLRSGNVPNPDLPTGPATSSSGT
jgi:chromosome segregation ATPase